MLIIHKISPFCLTDLGATSSIGICYHYKVCNPELSLQTHHVDSMLKGNGNDRSRK